MESTPEVKEKFFTKPLLVIFITIFIDLVGFGVAIPVLPQYAKEHFGASPFEIGWLTASYSIMQFIAAPFLGQLSDRYGRRPVLFISLLGTSIAACVTGLSTTLPMLFASRIFDGITGGNISTAQAYIADVTTKENRAKGMALIGMAFGLGFIFGPAIGGILSKFGYSVPFFFVSALALFNAIFLYFVLPETKHPHQFDGRKGRISELLETAKEARFFDITVIYFLAIAAFSIMTTVFSQYTMFRFRYDAVHNGYLFFYVGLIAAVIQGGVFARLAKAFGEAILITIGCLILTISFVIVPYVGPELGGLAALLAGIAFFSIGNSISAPALTSLASKEASEQFQGRAMGILQSAASLARAIGPALSGFLLYAADSPEKISDTSLFRTFWTAAAIMFVAFLFSLPLLRGFRAEAARTT